MSKKLIFSIISLVFVMCLVSGLIGAVIYHNYFEKKVNIFKDFYDTENSVSVSPATLKKMIDGKDNSYILVDLRSSDEYNIDHIVGAVNIPIVGMDESRILTEFKKLPQDKKIIMYCYSAYCMLSRQAGQLLADNSIQAQHLNLGWSEWKYYWSLWNPEGKTETGTKYIEKGNGIKSTTPNNCTSSNKFGC
jgi:rhodanese-related sulfurtransferase